MDFLTNQMVRSGWKPRQNIPMRCEPMKRSEVSMYFDLLKDDLTSSNKRKRTE